MKCARCLYEFGAFETECPKCAYLARTGRTPHQTAPQRPGSHGGAPPWERPREGRDEHRRTVPTYVLGICSLLLLVAVVGVVEHATIRARGGGSGQAASLRGGANLLVAASVPPEQIESRLLSAGASVGGELEFSLAWNTLTDLDLEVRDPSGELIAADHARSQSGGQQDVDANPTPLTAEGVARLQAGQPPGHENVVDIAGVLADFGGGLNLPSGFEGKAPSLYTRQPVEHIYFTHAPAGTYTVTAQCFCWREKDRRPLPFTVEMRSHGQVVRQVNGTAGPDDIVSGTGGRFQVCQFAWK